MVRKKATWWIAGVVVAICFLAFEIANVQADAAPEPLPDGKNIAPGEEITMVQMVAEEVIIDVSATEITVNMGEDYAFMTRTGYPVAYNCRFWMVNQGDETESMAVRFPIRAQYEVGTIDIQSIKINGEPVEWWEDEIDWYADFNWAHFNVIFPPGEEVEIKVTYTSLTQIGSWTNPLEVVTYVLETGAGWYGPIGKGRIILRLPYAASPQNVSLSGRPAEVDFTGTDVQWEFTDLEPDITDNFWVEVVSPYEWSVIESARSKLVGSPNNLSAHLRLAETIFSICIDDRSETVGYMPELFPEGLQAMANAVRLNPVDVNLHVQYARYLIANLNPETYELLLIELETIEERDPDSEALDSLYNSYPFIGYLQANPPTITPTITPEPTITPTYPPGGTYTPTPSSTPSPTKKPIPVPNKGSQMDTTEPTDIPIYTPVPTATFIPEPTDTIHARPSITLVIAGLGLLVVIALVVWYIRRK